MSAAREDGFTLIELVVVSLLLALLSAVVYGSITTLVRTKNVLEDRRVSERTAQSILSRLSRELENRQSEPLTDLMNKRGRSSRRGKDNDFLSLLIGRTRRLVGRDADSIRFVTLGSSASSNLGNPGIVEVEYRVEATNLSREAPFILLREEIPAGVDDRRILESRQFRSVLSDKIHSLQFRYRFNRRWVNQWSASRETLPDAVEITLSVFTDSGGVDTYRTAVLLYRQEEG